MSATPVPTSTFTLHVWVKRLRCVMAGSIFRHALESADAYMIRYRAETEHDYSASLPLGHPIPREGDTFTPVPDGPIFDIEEVQWEADFTPTITMRGEIGAVDWTRIKQLGISNGGAK